METIRERLYNAQQAHACLNAAYQQVKHHLLNGCAFDLVIRPETRTLAQNRLMWSRLGDLEAQAEPIPGRRFEDELWKHYITANLSAQEMFPNLDRTGLVVLTMAKPTSRMTKKEVAEVSDTAMLIGDEQGVRWSRTSLGRDWPEEVV